MLQPKSNNITKYNPKTKVFCKIVKLKVNYPMTVQWKLLEKYLTVDILHGVLIKSVI